MGSAIVIPLTYLSISVLACVTRFRLPKHTTCMYMQLILVCNFSVRVAIIIYTDNCDSARQYAVLQWHVEEAVKTLWCKMLLYTCTMSLSWRVHYRSLYCI